jgi:peptidoglycan/LPS O-acetylase OafA/YrhL
VSTVLVYPAAAADVICVLLFAIIGRSSHAEANDLSGVLHTAWPFLAGCLIGLMVGRAWRQPVSLRTGVIVWLCTAAGGMILRVSSGSTAQWPFIIVATVTLGLLIVGWRAIFRVVQRASSRPTQPARGTKSRHG